MGVVTCGGCGKKFNRSLTEAEFIKGKWYHSGCAQIKKEKMSLDAYICKIFGLKSPGPMNNVLIKKYRNELGYTYEGMEKALRFFYTIKRNSTDKSEERIGIIPHVYSDAQEYYFRIDQQQRRIASSATTEEVQFVTINLNKKKEKKNKTDNLSEIDGLFDEE